MFEAILGNLLLFGVLAVLLLVAAPLSLYVLRLRRVVAPNEVHIVQTRAKTVSYGKDMPGGNTYYDWPSWLPVIGLTKTVLPVSVFDLPLDGYDAYDNDRVPFLVDVVAFFRIEDPNTAAQRVRSFAELEDQLQAIVRGAVRTVLAKHDINQIMIERSKFGEHFTSEVAPQLVNWGVESVKNIELMDIRDARNSSVIANIMAKRTSDIERDSRSVVAENHRQAEMAEIVAKRDVELQRQQAEQQVGTRTAEKNREVGIAQERSVQEVLLARRDTVSRDMEVRQVEQVRAAEISKDVAVIEAEQDRQVKQVEAEAAKAVQIIAADAEKQATVTRAEGTLEQQRREAVGIQAIGEAKAVAERELARAPVQAQIDLAREIGGNEGYQKYLISLEQVKAGATVGVAQANALAAADIKVIATAGTPEEGLTSISEAFTVRGGIKLGTLLEGLQATDLGNAVLNRAGIKPSAPAKAEEEASA